MSNTESRRPVELCMCVPPAQPRLRVHYQGKLYLHWFDELIVVGTDISLLSP